jgi:hypothetical protein
MGLVLAHEYAHIPVVTQERHAEDMGFGALSNYTCPGGTLEDDRGSMSATLLWFLLEGLTSRVLELV